MNPDLQTTTRWGRAWVTLAVIAAVCATLVRTVSPIRTAWRPAWRDGAVRRLVTLTREPRLVAEEPSGSHFFSSLASVLWKLRDSKPEVAGAVLRLTSGDESAEALHASGVAYLVLGERDEAITRLRRAAREAPTAARMNNLAAAHLQVEQSGADELLAAIVAADEAIQIDPAMAAAVFNKADVLMRMGLRDAARQSWKEYVLLERDAVLREQARLRLKALPAASLDWKNSRGVLNTASTTDIVRLAERFPQEARTSTEGLFLSRWADARTDAPSLADSWLRVARIIGEMLDKRSNDSLLRDAVAAIDDAVRGGDLLRLQHLTEAQAAYNRGRLALHHNDLATAARELDLAARLFRIADSPMAGVAECYRAVVLRAENDGPSAATSLKRLLARERRAGTHGALIAHILWELAICEGEQAHWSDALAAAEESLQIFLKYGETGNAGAVEVIIAEAYDFLGQRHVAWQHVLSGIRASTAAGDDGRLRVMLGSACRIEVRRGNWRTSRSLARLEEAGATDPLLIADTQQRIAVAEHHLGNRAAAAAAILGARTAVSRIETASHRQRLSAYVDGVAGAIARRSGDYRTAIGLLTRALEFQLTTARAFFVPELLLERGRALAAAGDHVRAASDHESGIRELERQRSHVNDVSLRPGIFDDAAVLFREATELALNSGAAETAFGYAERGRARALREALGVSTHPSATRGQIAARIPEDTVLISYVLLPHRVVIFIVARQELAVRVVPLEYATLREILDELHRAIVPGSTVNARHGLAKLHRLLLAPVKDLTAKRTRLIVIADDILQHVPFSALYDEASARFTIEDHIVTVAPSAVLALTGTRVPRRRGDAAVFVNPTLATPFSSLPSLPNAEREGIRIAKAYNSRTLFMRDGATKAAFIAAVRNAAIAHFGGHAAVDAAQPGLSALLFSDHAGGEARLTSAEVARLNLDATRLVVLAACSTGRADARGIEGMPTLSKAFVSAGVPSVIGTLWDVEDSETAGFATTFHARVAGGAPPAQALRDACRVAIERKAPVGVWAAFQILTIE